MKELVTSWYRFPNDKPDKDDIIDIVFFNELKGGLDLFRGCEYSGGAWFCCGPYNKMIEAHLVKAWSKVEIPKL